MLTSTSGALQEMKNNLPWFTTFFDQNSMVLFYFGQKPLKHSQCSPYHFRLRAGVNTLLERFELGVRFFTEINL